MSKSKEKSASAHRQMDIRWYQAHGHDAEAEITALDVGPRDKALAVMARFCQLERSRFRIKKTRVEHVYESKHDMPEGGLRLFFVYGKNDVTWCIGGFVKTNISEGNRALKGYAAIAKLATIS